MIRTTLVSLLWLCPALLLAGERPPGRGTTKAPLKAAPWEGAPEDAKKSPTLHARLKTAKGEIVINLLTEEAPETVANFVQLAKGERPWKDKEGRWVAKPFYEGLTFHRIEKDELIQGGDPKGDGTGGPGYRFRDEISPKLRFDRGAIVAMANSGRNTNGSQFFITLVPLPRLDGQHTIFGHVVRGIDVVKTISGMPAGDSPGGPAGIHFAKNPVAIESVAIEEVKEEPKEAKKKGDED